MPSTNDLALHFRQECGTALIADAAYRCGIPVGIAPSAIAPLAAEWKIAGPVRTLHANNDLVSVIATVHHASPGDVVVITNPTREVGLLGDIIGTEAKRKDLGGFVVDGLVRDGRELIELGIPVFSRGLIPIGPLKLAPKLKGLGEPDREVMVGEVQVVGGMWAFGDADGVVFLPPERLPDVFEQARESEKRERGLFEAMSRGEALGDLLQVDRFLEERKDDPGANFGAHLNRIGRAI